MLGIDFSTHVTNPTAQGPGAAVASAQTAAEDDSPSFFDEILDVVNPLQHIPVISTIYRHLTGDKIDTASKVAGDALYGGIPGLLCSLGDTLFKEVTGKDVGDTVYAALIGDDSPPTTAVASAEDKTPASVSPAESSALEPIHLSFLENDQNSQPMEVASGTVANDLPVGLLHASLFEDTAPAQQTAAQAAMAYRASGKLLEAY